MKCEYCGAEVLESGTPVIALCCVCSVKRSQALTNFCVQWDREHRKPKKEVIEIEVPLDWIAGLNGQWGETNTPEVLVRTFLHPPGRLVLKARKE